MKINFDKIRNSLFGGKLKQTQVDGINSILESINKHGISKEQAAYVFATVYHETARTMQPIEEYGKGKGRPYGTWYKNSKGELFSWKNGNKNTAYLYKDYPHLYYGRSFPQLTWFDNYEKAGKILGVDFLRNPSLVMDLKYASEILVVGMMDGWFTYKKLSDYINHSKKDYYNARRIINSTDRAALIAEYASEFEDALF